MLRANVPAHDPIGCVPQKESIVFFAQHSISLHQTVQGNGKFRLGKCAIALFLAEVGKSPGQDGTKPNLPDLLQFRTDGQFSHHRIVVKLGLLGIRIGTNEGNSVTKMVFLEICLGILGKLGWNDYGKGKGSQQALDGPGPFVLVRNDLDQFAYKRQLGNVSIQVNGQCVAQSGDFVGNVGICLQQVAPLVFQRLHPLARLAQEIGYLGNLFIQISYLRLQSGELGIQFAPQGKKILFLLDRRSLLP